MLYINHRPRGDQHVIKQLTLAELQDRRANLHSQAALATYQLVSPLKIPSLGGESNRDKLYLQGAFVAEGWQSRKNGKPVGGGKICVSDLSFFQEINRRLLNVHQKQREGFPSRQKNGEYETYIPKSLLMDDFGHMAMRKHFLPFHLRLSEESMRDLLQGYIRGDGHVDMNRGKPRLVYGMTSATLADQLSIMHNSSNGQVPFQVAHSIRPRRVSQSNTEQHRS
jgi:hypothetical protein